MNSSNLFLQSIHVAFGESKILTDLSFRINEGEAKFIVGPNGSGKTTLFNVTIPSPISMGDLGFGRHPARLAVAWHPADSTMAKA